MPPRYQPVYELCQYPPDYEDVEPPRKKPRKVLEEKVAVWQDIKKEWKEEDDPLGRLPVEVLDLIISVDSDLELRDHLALSAVCRYFRSCYRDVVFQVLFQAEFPTVVCALNTFDIDTDGTPLPDHGPFHKPSSGPYNRSFDSARRIFSSGRSLLGAGGWAGWGLTGPQYEANELESLKAMEEIDRVIRQEDRAAAVSLLTKFEAERHLGSTKEEDAVVIKAHVYKRDDIRRSTEFNHGLPPHPRVARYLQLTTGSKSEDSELYDPWPSPWREQISDIVNSPHLSHSEAKSYYKVSDRELLSIKETDLSWNDDVKPGRHYLEASVKALAYRSHGGADGHYAYLLKLHERQERARENRLKKVEAKASVLATNPPSPTPAA